MIGAIDPYSSMQSMSSMSGMGKMQGPPPGPPPGDDPVDKLEAAVASGELDTETLSAKLLDVFGEDAEGIVSDDGSVDFEALSGLIASERTETMTTDLVDKFGADAAQFVSDTGEVDHKALGAFLQEQGIEPPEKGSLQGGMGRMGGAPSGYGASGQAVSSSPLSFLDMYA